MRSNCTFVTFGGQVTWPLNWIVPRETSWRDCSFEWPSRALPGGWRTGLRPRREQRVSDGVDRQSDAVRHSDLAHELTDMRLNGAHFDTELVSDLFVGAARDQQLQHFALTFADLVFPLGQHPARRCGSAFDKRAQHSPGRPHRTAVYGLDRMFEFVGRRALGNIALRACCNRPQNLFIAGAGPRDNNANGGTHCL